MANEKIALGINLRKNKISTSSAYGKYYPEVDLQKTLSLRGFAEHMTAHGAKYRRAEVEGGGANEKKEKVAAFAAFSFNY